MERKRGDRVNLRRVEIGAEPDGYSGLKR